MMRKTNKSKAGLFTLIQLTENQLLPICLHISHSNIQISVNFKIILRIEYEYNI